MSTRFINLVLSFMSKSQTNKKVVSVINVSKFYGSNSLDSKKVLSEVNLDIFEGEILAILGPNGAGKTTLINMMLGRLSLSSGEISLLGHQPGNIELKRQCGAMLQVSSLPDMSTVREHIELFQSYYTNPMDYSQVIEFAQLSELESKYSRDLSGGQKQRLLFALSICGNPKLLFLDEPTVGLDISARRSLWKAIIELKHAGTSVVLTTHYLEEADHLSDRIVIINNGKVIKIGTPKEIKSEFNSKTIRFNSDVNAEVFSKLHAVKKVRTQQLANQEIQIEIETSDPINTLKEIFSAELIITDLTIAGAALEDAFIKLNQKSKQHEGDLS